SSSTRVSIGAPAGHGAKTTNSAIIARPSKANRGYCAFAAGCFSLWERERQHAVPRCHGDVLLPASLICHRTYSEAGPRRVRQHLFSRHGVESIEVHVDRLEKHVAGGDEATGTREARQVCVPNQIAGGRIVSANAHARRHALLSARSIDVGMLKVLRPGL